MELINRELATILLRRFEPIIHFTSGEHFFPMQVEPYVRSCSLWLTQPNRDPEQLVAEGELTLEQLGQSWPDTEGAVHYLKFIEPLDLAEMAAAQFPWKHDGNRGGKFRPDRARLARVGYVSRMADALYSLALLARGRVPGDTSAAAQREYGRFMAEDEDYLYHGRVVRQGDWVVLQYWFFYPFNDWRSGFSGANDHESDWEMMCIYLAEEDVSEEGIVTEPVGAANEAVHDAIDARAALRARAAEDAQRFHPEWVAYASHDYSGDDLRRRWDDPEVKKIGEHPLIYAGAGSHASYFSRGEYLTEIELPFISPVVRLTDRLKHFMHDTLKLYIGDHSHDDAGHSSIFHIPFVDYARGDGLCIGPQQEVEWSDPALISPAPPWVSEYRGLWGLYARDPFNGENAPAGPKYNRDGTTRRSWYDPVGWAGLDKVLPSTKALAAVEMQMKELKDHRAVLTDEIAVKNNELVGLGVQVDAMRQQSHLTEVRKLFQMQLDEQSAEVEKARSELASNNTVLESLAMHARRLRAGEPGPMRAHIHRAHTPTTSESVRIGRITEIWAAISVSVMLFVFVWVILFARQYVVHSFFSIILTFAVLEAAFRRRLTNLITTLAIILSVVATGVLFFQFFWYWIVILILVIGAYILFENVREIIH